MASVLRVCKVWQLLLRLHPNRCVHVLLMGLPTVGSQLLSSPSFSVNTGSTSTPAFCSAREKEYTCRCQMNVNLFVGQVPDWDLIQPSMGRLCKQHTKLTQQLTRQLTRQRMLLSLQSLQLGGFASNTRLWA